jgi:hypothetical protein
MARPVRPTQRQPAPVIPTNALVASATRFDKKVQRVYQQTQNWQTECYRHYAICGEARFAANFFGHALSKAMLTISEKTPDGLEVQTSGPGYDALTDLFNGKDGQAQMLQAAGTHLTIAGECYLVGRTIRGENVREGVEVADGEELWEVLSPLEIKTLGTGENTRWFVTYGDGYEDIELSADDAVIRIWSPNPAKRMEADSPFRSLLPILTEIEWLTRHIFAQVSSRLVGAGILWVSQGLSFPPPLDQDGKAIEVKNEADGLMRVLGDVMVTSMADNGTAESQVPIIVSVPPELMGKHADLMHFWSNLDEASMELRSEAIRRFAIGMDLPAEQILGMSSNEGTGGGNSNGVSHWGAWQIEEATIKMHIEPMLELIANALTIGYIRPLLPNSSAEVVTYDTSALKLRPDRSAEAFELYDRGAISLVALLRENGFESSDAPADDELKTYFLRKIASGSATPEQVAAALKLLFDIDLPSEVPDGAFPVEPRETRPNPSLEDHPDRPRTPAETPTPDPPNHASLTLAAEGLVLRALEKAGNRILNDGKRGKDRAVPTSPAYEAYLSLGAGINGHGEDLLRDGFAFAPQILDGLASPDEVVPILHRYCLDLFESKEPHTRERLSSYLRELTP